MRLWNELFFLIIPIIRYTHMHLIVVGREPWGLFLQLLSRQSPMKTLKASALIYFPS